MNRQANDIIKFIKAVILQRHRLVKRNEGRRLGNDECVALNKLSSWIDAYGDTATMQGASTIFQQYKTFIYRFIPVKGGIENSTHQEFKYLQNITFEHTKTTTNDRVFH